MRYTWERPDSLIREVEIHSVGKQHEAIIFAPAGAEAARLAALEQNLRDAGFSVIPDTFQHRHALRVEQLSTEQSLLDALKRNGAVLGDPNQEATAQELKPPPKLADRFKQNTVKAAGYAYVLGDALMIAAGLLRMKGLWNNPEERKGGMHETATGITWAVPNIGLIVYGKKNPEVQLGVMMRGLQNYMTEQGITIPEDDQHVLNQLARKETTLNRLEEFAYDHPTQINNTVEAIGGLKLAQAGLAQTIDGKRNYYKFGQGMFVAAGMGGSVLVQEKKPPAFEQAAHAQEQRKEGFFARKIDWFLEKPLRLAGWGASVNNVLGLIGPAVYERPAAKKFLEASKNGVAGKTSQEVALARTKAQNYLQATGLNVGTSLAFLAANGMYSLGSKDTGVDLKASGALEQVYALTAHVIAAHPKAQQADLINQLAGYFSTRDEFKDSAPEIAQQLSQKVAGLQHSPWTQRIQATSAQNAQPSL